MNISKYKLDDKYILIDGNRISKEHINKIEKYHVYSVDRKFYYFLNGEMVSSIPNSKKYTYQGIKITAYNKSTIFILETLDGYINKYNCNKQFNEIINWYKEY